jgi:hypothetical protein
VAAGCKQSKPGSQSQKTLSRTNKQSHDNPTSFQCRAWKGHVGQPALLMRWIPIDRISGSNNQPEVTKVIFAFDATILMSERCNDASGSLFTHGVCTLWILAFTQGVHDPVAWLVHHSFLFSYLPSAFWSVHPSFHDVLQGQLKLSFCQQRQRCTLEKWQNQFHVKVTVVLLFQKPSCFKFRRFQSTRASVRLFFVPCFLSSVWFDRDDQASAARVKCSVPVARCLFSTRSQNV